ncbi:uncharacterized protein ppp1r3ab [Stigmatopora nigra]
MESEGQSGPPNTSTYPLLHVPDLDEDDGEVEISIRPKCSPLPRRRTSFSDDEGEEPGPVFTPGGSRRVSFADSKGLNLVYVKEFDSCDVPTAPQLDVDGISAAEEYSMAPLTFQSPLSPEELLVRVQEQKIELESLELIPGTTTLKGLVCVLNMSFHKVVYVRTTLDSWVSHFDLLTEYIPNFGHAHMDRFAFKLTLVPPFPEQGSRVDFCLRYETPVGTFWANNDCRNYVLVCRTKAKEWGGRHEKKSCLKSVSQIFSEDVLEISTEKLSEDKPTKEDGVNQAFQPNQLKEDSKNLQVEIKQNCSRRNQRKAARMARVKDYFSQRDAVEPKPKHEDPTAIPDKTLDKTPSGQNESRTPNKSQTPEKITLSSLPQGDVSTPKSNNNEYFKNLVSEAEKKTENCQSPSNGVHFEHQLPGRTEDDWTWPENTQEVNSIVLENVTWNKQDVRILQNLVSNDVKKQDSVDGVHGSVTEDPGMRSMDKMQNYEDIWENVTKNGTGISSIQEVSQMDTSASGSSPSVQNHSETIGEDQQVSSTIGGRSDGEEEEEVVTGHQKHDEKQLNNGTGESRNSDFEISLSGNNIWTDMDSHSRASLDFESENIQGIRQSEGGVENNDAVLATFKNLVSGDVKNQTGLEFDELDRNSVGGATNSEDFNRPKSCSFSADDGTSIFLENREETCIREDQFCEDLDNHSQAVSFFVAIADSWHENLQEPDRSPEIDQIQNWEAMLEEANISEELEPKNCPGIARLDNLKEDIAPLNETLWGAEAHLVQILEDKKDLDGVEDKDDNRKWQLDQKKLEEELWKHLCEDGGSEEDPKTQILAETGLQEDDQLSEEPETDSDDEVELYMHCLRAVHTKDRGAEATFGLSERSSLRRSKSLSSPMPSISEVLDEERGGGGLRESRENPSPKPSRPKMADGNVLTCVTIRKENLREAFERNRRGALVSCLVIGRRAVTSDHM